MSKRSQQIDALFRQGQHLHVAGRLAEAEQIYRQVVAAAPRHAEALHALGAVALQAGNAVVADALLTRAVGLRPAAEFQLTRASALLALNRPQDAERASRLALRGRPDSAAGYQVLGHALCDSGRPDAAIEAYRTALRLNPKLPDIRNNLGTVLRQLGRLTEAERELRQAPPEPEALANLSSVQKELGAFADAEATLRRALLIAPHNPVLRYNWSLLMLLLGRTEEAWDGWEQRFRAGAVPDRCFAEPQWRGQPLGSRTLLVHSEQGLGDVIQFARYLPGIGGFVLFEAPPRLIRLLSSNPAMPPMIPVGGTPQIPIGGTPQIPVGGTPQIPVGGTPQIPVGGTPQIPVGGTPQIAVGGTPQIPVGGTPQIPIDGKSQIPVGKTPQIASAGAPPQLAPGGAHLREPNGGLSLQIPEGRLGPHVGAVIPLLSLPARTPIMPVKPPYLFAEPDRLAAWRERIRPGGLRVGIAWQGFPHRFADKGRSIPLTAFAPLAAVPGLRLISLQKGEGEQQVAGAGFTVEALDGLDDGPDAFLDTAAVMMVLDLIITSDTSVAHLAGALGRPVWIALRLVPDWRWMLARADSPWYPTARLFRQTTDGEWGPVFAAMAAALRP